MKYYFALFMLLLFITLTTVLTAQTESGSFEFEGYTRNYVVFSPQNYKENMPIVLNLHGYTDNAIWQMEYSKFHLINLEGIMKSKNYQSVLMILTFLGYSNIAMSQWMRVADMPTARNAHAVATVNGKIYAVGGEQILSVILEEYDPLTDSWTTKKNMPTKRSWLSFDSVNEKIYAIGGYNESFNQLTVPNVEEYNTVTNTWTTKSPMPEPRWGPATGVVNGKIYVIAGAINWPIDKMYDEVWEYDPTTNTWTTKSTSPTKRWGQSWCVVNGKIYIIGGYYSGNSITTVEEYDPATNRWTRKSPMPTARWGHTTGTLDGKIYAMGGGIVYPPRKPLTVVEEYDLASDTWTTKASMPIGRIALAPSAVSLDGKIYVVGGGGILDTEAYSEVFIYKPCDYWPKSAEIFTKYISVQGESLKVNVEMANSENHQLNVYAKIVKDDHSIQDSIQLFDDGQHGDENATDNIWGGAKWLSGLSEDMFTIKININDTTHLFPSEPRFTTIGPVKASAIDVHYSEQARNQFIKLVLHNEGAVATAENLRVTISTNDPRIEQKIFNTISFPDVAAGITDTSNSAYYFNYAAGYGPDSTLGNPILFDYTISSNKIDYWTGSFDFTATITGIDDKQLNTVPQKLKLYQNYPNPFNPSTRIEYYLPVATKVTLKIYNLAGQEIEMLVNEFQTIGVHQITWQPKSLPNGLYFCKLQAGKFSDTRKLILQK